MFEVSQVSTGWVDNKRVHFTLLFQTLWYEVGRQHVKALQAAAISPYLTSPTPPIPLQRKATTPGTSCPTLFEQCVGSLTSHIELINMEGICETQPTVYSPYPRRLESVTICWCNYKGSTFYSVILRPWVMVRPESNSRPPAWQPDAHLTKLLTIDVIYLEYLLIFTVSRAIVQHFSTVSGCKSFRCLSSPPKSLRKRFLLFNKCFKCNSKEQREFVELYEKGKVLLWLFMRYPTI